jgi:phosphoserine phosphatase RsbU/P
MIATEEALRQSEQRYKKLLESVTDYIYSVQIDRGHACTTSHGVGCIAVTGYTPEDFASDPFLWYRMVHEDDRQTVIEQTARVLAGGDVPPLEHRIRHRDGSIRWIRNTMVVRRDEFGRPISYDGLIVDVTERRRAAEALRDSEALYHSLVETIPINMFRKDTHGRFTFANRRFCEALGKSLEEIVAKTDYDFYPAALADKYRRDDQTVLSTGATFEDTECHQTPQGEQLYVAVIKTPVHDAQRRMIGTQGMFWDVTASKWAEDQKTQLRFARAIQQKLLPKAAPLTPHYEFGGQSYPAEACSGDYFDYLVFDDSVDIVIGDVSGHGFGPALLAAVTHACLRTLALSRTNVGLEAILAAANRLLLADTDSEHFVTLVYARIELKSGTLVYSNAGHPPAFLLDAAGNLKMRLVETGPLLGVFPDGVFPKAPAVPLAAGDLVLFLSDGVLEAMPATGSKFGIERTLDVVRCNRKHSAQVIADRLCDAARAYFGNSPQSDDITAVVIKVT